MIWPPPRKPPSADRVAGQAAVPVAGSAVKPAPVTPAEPAPVTPAEPAPVTPVRAAAVPDSAPSPEPTPLRPPMPASALGPVVIPRRRGRGSLVAANAYPAAATEAARIPTGEFLGLWLGIPALLAGCAYVLLGTILLARTGDGVVDVLWPVWLTIALGLQVPYWALLTGRAGMALTAALPGIGLVTTYRLTRDLLRAAQR